MRLLANDAFLYGSNVIRVGAFAFLDMQGDAKQQRHGLPGILLDPSADLFVRSYSLWDLCTNTVVLGTQCCCFIGGLQLELSMHDVRPD